MTMELALSNLMRHAFIQGFVKNGGTVTAAIILWPEYDPGKCLDRVNESIIQARSQAFEELESALKAKKYLPSQGIDAEMESFNDGLDEAIEAIRQHSQKGRDT